MAAQIDTNLLVRTWSADALYGPGAQSDETITFFPDGTGVFEQLNWGSGSVVSFRWSSGSGGRLEIVPEREFELDGDALSLVPSTHEAYATDDATIATQVLPLIGESLVLCLPSFGESFLGGYGDDVFGYDPRIKSPNYVRHTCSMIHSRPQPLSNSN